MFENVLNICMNHYGLNPAWYFSAPGLAWDAVVEITKVQLELLGNPAILLIKVVSEAESQQYHTAMLMLTTNIWERSSILQRNPNSSHI